MLQRQKVSLNGQNCQELQLKLETSCLRPTKDLITIRQHSMQDVFISFFWTFEAKRDKMAWHRFFFDCTIQVDFLLSTPSVIKSEICSFNEVNCMIDTVLTIFSDALQQMAFYVNSLLIQQIVAYL